MRSRYALVAMLGAWLDFGDSCDEPWLRSIAGTSGPDRS